MEEYFKDVEEESIRDNFVIVYELMDELVDFGYPQTTDGKILQEYITQEGNWLILKYISRFVQGCYFMVQIVTTMYIISINAYNIGHKLEIAPKPPPAVTNAVSWRTEGVKYRKNEVFLDVIESVNLLAGMY